MFRNIRVQMHAAIKFVVWRCSAYTTRDWTEESMPRREILYTYRFGQASVLQCLQMFAETRILHGFIGVFFGHNSVSFQNFAKQIAMGRLQINLFSNINIPIRTCRVSTNLDSYKPEKYITEFAVCNIVKQLNPLRQ